jgi:hypothetical protein
MVHKQVLIKEKLVFKLWKPVFRALKPVSRRKQLVFRHRKPAVEL